MFGREREEPRGVEFDGLGFEFLGDFDEGIESAGVGVGSRSASALEPEQEGEAVGIESELQHWGRVYRLGLDDFGDEQVAQFRVGLLGNGIDVERGESTLLVVDEHLGRLE